MNLNDITMGEDCLRRNAKLLGLSPDAPERSRDRLSDKKVSKYHNVKTEYNDRIYSSGREAARAQELQLLEKAGEIFALCYQVRFKLPGNIHYVADFCYLELVVSNEPEQLRIVVEDTKSEVTRKIATYRMKRKLFREKYGINITES